MKKKFKYVLIGLISLIIFGSAFGAAGFLIANLNNGNDHVTTRPSLPSPPSTEDNNGSNDTTISKPDNNPPVIEEGESNSVIKPDLQNWYIENINLPSMQELKDLDNNYDIYHNNGKKPLWLDINFDHVIPLKNISQGCNLPLDLNKQVYTDEDFMEMFDYIATKDIKFPMFAGNKKIDAKRLSNIYIKWTVSRWKYFPSFSLENGNIKFTVKNKVTQEIKTSKWFSEKELNDDWELYSISSADYADRMFINGKYKDAFIDFVYNGLALISDDMTDRDKTFVIYNYVMNFFKYGGIIYDQDEAIYLKDGVCANYACAYSYLLNLIGIEALPMLTGLSGNSSIELHEVIWVKLDLKNSGEKKWYLSDATFGDYNDKNDPLGGYYAYMNINRNLTNFIAPVGFSKFAANDPMQFPFNQYWCLPLASEVSDNAFYGSSLNYNYIFDYKILEKQDGTYKPKYYVSNYIYVDGSYYLLRKNNITKKCEFVYGSFNSNIDFLKNVSIANSPFSGISDENIKNILNISGNENDYPLLWKKDNLVFFILNNVSNSEKKLLVYNLENKKEYVVELSNIVDHDILNNSVMSNFYLDRDTINFEFNNSDKVYSTNLIELLKKINCYSITKVSFERELLVAKVKLDSYRIGNKYWEINESYKKWFNMQLLNIEDKSNETNPEYKSLSAELSELMSKIDLYFSIKDKEMYLLKNIDSIIEIDEPFIKGYGYNLSRIVQLGKDVNDVFNFNGDYIVKLYYKQDEQFVEYKLNAKYLYDAKISYNDAVYLQNKTLKMELISSVNSNNKFTTKDFQIQLTNNNEQFIKVEKLIVNNNIIASNLTNIPLSKQDISYDTDLVLNAAISNIKLDTYSYDINLIFETENKKQILYSSKIDSTNYKFSYNLSKLTSDKVGTYYIRIQQRNNQTNEIYDIFSNNVFIFNESSFNLK